jgi:hypothetical protein
LLSDRKRNRLARILQVNIQSNLAARLARSG